MNYQTHIITTITEKISQGIKTVMPTPSNTSRAQQKSLDTQGSDKVKPTPTPPHVGPPFKGRLPLPKVKVSPLLKGKPSHPKITTLLHPLPSPALKVKPPQGKVVVPPSPTTPVSAAIRSRTSQGKVKKVAGKDVVNRKKKSVARKFSHTKQTLKPAATPKQPQQQQQQQRKIVTSTNQKSVTVSSLLGITEVKTTPTLKSVKSGSSPNVKVKSGSVIKTVVGSAGKVKSVNSPAGKVKSVNSPAGKVKSVNSSAGKVKSSTLIVINSSPTAAASIKPIPAETAVTLSPVRAVVTSTSSRKDNPKRPDADLCPELTSDMQQYDASTPAATDEEPEVSEGRVYL